jgi:hypothetical protein
MELFLKITPLLDVTTRVRASAPAAPVDPVAPVIDFDQAKTKANALPLAVTVKVIDPEEDPPRVDPEATERVSDPFAEVVPAVFVPEVMPEGSVPTAIVAAIRLVPWYAVNGIVIVVAAEVAPDLSQAILTD